MRYIGMFGEISRKESHIYGGKAASLGDLYQAGIPVPNGFGISIEAHREFRDKPFSDEFKAELKDTFDRLGVERVAVRSSAIAEDAGDASWAGQLESFLNITEDQLETMIRKCWDSIESEHAKDYAADKDLGKDSLLVGVAVQTMVDSEIAGVMFTVNPVTKELDKMMIEGAYGLGETVVQGIVTPDNYIVDKNGMHVSEFNIQVKQKMMSFREGENAISDVPDEIADRAIMREEDVVELANIGRKVEEYFQAPQDIEWARASGQFFIVQARPITTL